eukprot:TRINITY_DN8058_c1_g1_i1.p1 TRINITY_DN8058_c1_g1~~TRINITY_DN8058_c1_g1_i1.p1  ORF type:complete len:382 (-),score=50.43 TRINITY_DN8058_c1_g1_i1:401-1546(-)
MIPFLRQSANDGFQSVIGPLYAATDYSDNRTHRLQRGQVVDTRVEVLHQQNAANAERDNLIACLHDARLERDQAIASRNVIIEKQSALLTERDEARTQRDESRLQLQQAIIAKHDALHQNALASAERDSALAQRDEAQMQLDQVISEQRGVLHHQTDACESYRIIDVDGTRTIRVACPGADEKDVDILSHPNGVDITIRGIEADNAAGLPARIGFHKELRFEQKIDGIYSCSSCSLHDGILTVVLERIASQKLPVIRGGNESPVGRLILGATRREAEESSSISSSSSWQMTYNRDWSMPRAHSINRFAEEARASMTSCRESEFAESQATETETEESHESPRSSCAPSMRMTYSRESGVPFAIVDDGPSDAFSAISETGSLA